jgi:hypothetical protein
VRAARLQQLEGIEHRIYAEPEGGDRIFALADEDLERGERGKASAVHFLRFQFPPAAIAALRDGGGLWLGIDDGRLPERARVGEDSRAALLADFRR